MANDSPGDSLAAVVVSAETPGITPVGEVGVEAGNVGRDDEDTDKYHCPDHDPGTHQKPNDEALKALLSAIDQHPTSSTVKEEHPNVDQTNTLVEIKKGEALGSAKDGVQKLNGHREVSGPNAIEPSMAPGFAEAIVDAVANGKDTMKQPSPVNPNDEETLTALAQTLSSHNSLLPESKDSTSTQDRISPPTLEGNHDGAKSVTTLVQHNDDIASDTGPSHLGQILLQDAAQPSSAQVSKIIESHEALNPGIFKNYNSTQLEISSMSSPANPLLSPGTNGGARYPAGVPLPFPSSNGDAHPPMSAAELTNAILSLSYPFPSNLEPTLPTREEGQRIDAYVKLCFDDGNVYYIKNAAVVFGRAESPSRERALNRSNKKALKGRKQLICSQDVTPKYKGAKSITSGSSASLNGPRTPNNSRRTSVAMTTHTGLISNYNESSRSFFTDPFAGSKTTGTPHDSIARVDEEALIHLPPTGEPAKKNISRRHARLSYNAEKSAFELEVMGKNGAFVEDEWVECGSTWLLHKEGGHTEPSGEKAWRIQIGGVGFALIFPPRDPLENAQSGVAAVGKEGDEGMSLAFLDGSGKEVTTDFNEEEEEEQGFEDNEEDEEDDEAEQSEEEDVDSELEAEEIAYAMAPSADEDDSSDGYEDDDEAPLPPVRGKQYVNGFHPTYVNGEGEDEEEDENDEDERDVEEEEEEEAEVEEEEEEEEEGEDEHEPSSSDDDGEEFTLGSSRKRKRPQTQQKPVARKNLKILMALKKPKLQAEADVKRGRGRPKRETPTKAAIRQPTKLPSKVPPTKAPTNASMKGPGKGLKGSAKKRHEAELQRGREKERERERREREKRELEERQRKIQEEERRRQREQRERERQEAARRKTEKLARREVKERLIRERQLKKERELKEVLENKKQKAAKDEKARREAEERILLQRQEKLMREAALKDAAFRARQKAKETAEDGARQKAKIQLPTTSSSTMPASSSVPVLPPLQLPTASASETPAASFENNPFGQTPNSQAGSLQPSPIVSSYYDHSRGFIDPAFGDFEDSSKLGISTLPPSANAPSSTGYVPPNLQRQVKPPKEAKPRKEKPPPRRKRSPSPPINEADLPPEALLKPNASYLILIHEAISNSEKKMLSLPDIYRAIQRRYPYFKLKVSTTGWQSSVRHNLSQSTAFEKVQREGKGWLWKITDGFNIEKEKKKKQLPPPPLSQLIHPPLIPYGQMVTTANGMTNMPIMGYAARGQQHGIPMQNGMYMAPRAPAAPNPASSFAQQPQYAQPDTAQQPNQYGQVLHQSTITTYPTQQPNAIANSGPRTTAVSASAPRANVPRAPIPPPPVSNAIRIQMAQLATQRPSEQRSAPAPTLATQSRPASSPSGTIDTASLAAIQKLLNATTSTPPTGASAATNPQPPGHLAQLQGLLKLALDPNSGEKGIRAKQLLAGALEQLKQQKAKPLSPVPAQHLVPPVKASVPAAPHAIPHSPTSVATGVVNSVGKVNTTTTTVPLSNLKTPIPTPHTLSTQHNAPTAVPPLATAPQHTLHPAIQTNASVAPANQQSQQPVKPASSAAQVVPKVNTAALINLLARVKAQKAASVLGQNLSTTATQHSLSAPQAQPSIPPLTLPQNTRQNSTGPVPPVVPQEKVGEALQVAKRSIDEINGRGTAKVSGDSITESPVAKKLKTEPER